MTFAYCLLLIAFCLLLIAFCLLPFAFCLLLIAYCLLPFAYCLLPYSPFPYLCPMATETTVPAIEISDEVKQSLLTETVEEGQVIVHVGYNSGGLGDLIRIWATTFLVPQDGGERSKLVTKENISLAPAWTIIQRKGRFHFTLVFSPLPKSCKLFHLFEDIPEPGGFIIRNIRRNETDVYEVELV